MSYTDLRDFEAEYTLARGSLTVQVEKLGGGTVGRAYAGTWRYIVTDNGREIARGQDFESNWAMTHHAAAWSITEYMIPEGV